MCGEKLSISNIKCLIILLSECSSVNCAKLDLKYELTMCQTCECRLIETYYFGSMHVHLYKLQILLPVHLPPFWSGTFLAFQTLLPSTTAISVSPLSLYGGFSPQLATDGTWSRSIPQSRLKGLNTSVCVNRDARSQLLQGFQCSRPTSGAGLLGSGCLSIGSRKCHEEGSISSQRRCSHCRWVLDMSAKFGKSNLMIHIVLHTVCSYV